MPLDKDVLTTGEVAKICQVAPRTVSKWFDSGQLGGYRIPGSKDRRIPVAELYRFMKAHGIPVEGIAMGQTRVLIVDSHVEIVDALERALREGTDYEIRTANSAFKAGLECERFRPHVVLLDIHIADTEGKSLADLIRDSDHMQMTRVVAMSGKLTDGQAQGLRSAGYDGFLKKPFPVRDAVKIIENVTSVVH
ncbi:MAG: response regulator [Phycisphaeraceae bacterium]|nr:response regulator [Phycisphaeraceae bacterium]MCW5762802.1 response regulator [Phycisphaeraceae bacterium]